MLDTTAPRRQQTYRFGPFRLLPTARLLMEGEKAVPIGSRALEILIALVERHGELVSKDALLARVWPNTVVVETNLTVQVTKVRRALRDGRNGNRFLINVPGRGYRFIAQVITTEEMLLENTGARRDQMHDSVTAPHEPLENPRVNVSSGEIADLAVTKQTLLASTLRQGIRALEVARALVSREKSPADTDPTIRKNLPESSEESSTDRAGLAMLSTYTTADLGMDHCSFYCSGLCPLSVAMT